MVVEFLGLVGHPLPPLVVFLHRLARVADVILDDLGQVDAAVACGTHGVCPELVVGDVVERLNQVLILCDLLILLLLKLLERSRARDALVECGRLAAGIG